MVTNGTNVKTHLLDAGTYVFPAGPTDLFLESIELDSFSLKRFMAQKDNELSLCHVRDKHPKKSYLNVIGILYDII